MPASPQLAFCKVAIYRRFRFPLVELHLRHIRAAFSSRERPPLLWGSMWSMVKSSQVRLLPQPSHLREAASFGSVQNISHFGLRRVLG